MNRIDLNADPGGLGQWRLGDDDALLTVMTSANVAYEFARATGDRVRYVEPHGTRYNRIVHDAAQAATGLSTVEDAFTDRAYRAALREAGVAVEPFV